MVIKNILLAHELRDHIRPHVRRVPVGVERDMEVTAEHLAALEVRHATECPRCHACAPVVRAEWVLGHTVFCVEVFPCLSRGQVVKGLVVQGRVVVEERLHGLDVLDFAQLALQVLDCGVKLGEFGGVGLDRSHG